MANTFKTPTWMAREVLRHIENSLAFAKFVNKDYRAEFTQTDIKPGTTIKIPKPARFTVTSGAVASFPDITEDEVSLTVAQSNASFAPTSVEMTTSVDRERFSSRYLRPMGIALASQIDKDGLAMVTRYVSNATGTPAATPSALVTYTDARAIAFEHGMPTEDISCVVNPAAESKIIDALKGLMNPTSSVSEQYTKGKMGTAAGMKWSMDQLVENYTLGARGGTPVVNGANQTGASLITDGWSNSITGVVKRGDIFTIAGMYAVNPITKASTGRLQQFVVTADADSDGSGNCTIAISPSILTVAASPTTATVSTLVADGVAMTFLGTLSTIGASNVLFHKDAFTLASIPMVTYGGLDKCAVEYDADTGIAVRIMQGVDVTNDKLLVRGDVLYGWAATRPEWAARVLG